MPDPNFNYTIVLKIKNFPEDNRSIKQVLKQAGVVHNTKPQQNN